MRKSAAADVLKRLLEAKEQKLKKSNFDEHGNVNFGLTEYIDIPGMKYDPEIGIIGLQVCVTLERPGFRIKRRKLKKSDIGKHHAIAKEDAISFMTKEYSVVVEE